MDEKVEDCVSEWQRKLSLVLELIESHPDCIVDDTSVEKLLSWVRETAADEVQRNLLLHKNTTILDFLLNQPESLFSNALCGSFSLRLAGILAGCDEEVCKMLIDNGCLHNLFAGFERYDLTYFSDVAVKCAFFDGFSSVVSNYVGFMWSTSFPGLIRYAISALADSSFFVAKAAISFLKDVLLAIETHKANQTSHEIKAIILQILEKDTLKCTVGEKCCYLDLLYQMFDLNPDLAWELLDTIGGVTSLLLNVEGNPVKLLLKASELCHQIIQSGSEHSRNVFEDVLRVSIQIAKTDIIHLFQHLTCIVYSNGVSAFKKIPEYWNKSIITLVLLSLLGKHSGVGQISFDEKPTPTIDKNAMPDEFLLLFIELESIVNSKLDDKVIWKKCLTVTMDTCMEVFSKYQRETLGDSEKYLVQCWVLFLCEILKFASESREEVPALSRNAFIACICGHKYLIRKCIAVKKVILKNGWFQDFSTDVLARVFISLVRVLDDSTTEIQALSSCIQFFGSYINVLDKKLSQPVFADYDALNPQSDNSGFAEEFQLTCSKLPSLLEKLLLDSRWEIQDSILDLLSDMVSNLKGSCTMENFLVREKFWLKSWKLLDADESYVRSATVRFIGLVHENLRLREILLTDQSLETILSKLLGVFLNDDEAFPKRSMIDVVFRWIGDDELMCFLTQNEIDRERDSYQDQMWNFIFEVLRKAHASFDWEVKMKGICCWAKILIPEDGSLDNEEEVAARIKRLEIVCREKGPSILIHSLDDCDRMVCECALTTLQKVTCVNKESTRVQKDLASAQDIVAACEVDITSIHEFSSFLDRIDFELLSNSIKSAVNDVNASPTSLLTDIIAAAETSDDNLLDCY